LSPAAPWMPDSTESTSEPPDAEARRLDEDVRREQNWKRWGPYLSERQWATVREDYSKDGSAWSYFPHEDARSRVYRWGEDGLLGICDRQIRLCFAVALWNGQDPFLKERLYGLTGPQGNHGEDVKELYHYLDSTPTHSFMRALYRYPQAAFPYEDLVEENARRDKTQPEYELVDTGVFDEDRYFDITAEYAKASPNDILIRIRVANRGPDPASIHVLPTLWCRNTWAWGRVGEDEYWPAPSLRVDDDGRVEVVHASLGTFLLSVDRESFGAEVELLFTDNETNDRLVYDTAASPRYTKDAFHEYVVEGRAEAVRPERTGTKAAACARLDLDAGEERVLRLRLTRADQATPEPFDDFEATFQAREAEAAAFYEARFPEGASDDERNVLRQAYAGLMWCKQAYYYVVADWLDGDPGQPAPPKRRGTGRNADWRHVHARDVLSMPDAWEYPWFAAWDLAFHVLPIARIDPYFAKKQMILLLREWYTRPDGALPAYEWSLGDVNPPVHAWACWHIYKTTAPPGERDRVFLARVFQKLLINFTWWVNRKDPDGRNLFTGGFLGLDNIGVFDRSRPLPTDGRLEQADGTAWMAFYCVNMLAMALELAREDPSYEDIATKFFEHFIAITDAMNSLAGQGLWDEEDGFYYDVIRTSDSTIPLKLRSLVGLLPLIAGDVFEEELVQRLPAFRKRVAWFMQNRPDLAGRITSVEARQASDGHTHRLLAVPTLDQLRAVLETLLDEEEFLSPYGLRSLSRRHLDNPFQFDLDGAVHSVQYAPGESTTRLFGGNSNWRGPIWFPTNFLLIEALERYHRFYGDELRVEYPSGSGRKLTLDLVAQDLWSRLGSLLLQDENGDRPCHGGDARYREHPGWRNLVLFYEHFHGDDGRGLGASHQTGWTALVIRCIHERVEARRAQRRAEDGQ